MVNSTTLLVDAAGVLHTNMPLSVADLMSILSTPTPARPMNPRDEPVVEEHSITSEVIFVALRTPTASKPPKTPDKSSSTG